MPSSEHMAVGYEIRLEHEFYEEESLSFCIYIILLTGFTFFTTTISIPTIRLETLPIVSENLVMKIFSCFEIGSSGLEIGLSV